MTAILLPEVFIRLPARESSEVTEADAYEGLLSGVRPRKTLGQETLSNLSLPDPWSHCLIFRDALLIDTHVYRPEALEQWRGLLAVLALQGALDIPLRSEEFTAAHPSELARILFDLPPRGTWSDKAAAWDRVTVLTWDRGTNGGNTAPIGLLCLSTLVCPSRSTVEPVQGVTWIRDGRFIDPVKAGLLGSQELGLLAKYCEECSEVLAASRTGAQADVNLIDRLTLELHNFSDDARLSGGVALTATTSVETLGNSAQTYGLLAATHIPSTSARLSDLVLCVRDELDRLAGRQRFILIDPPDAMLGGKRAAEIVVWEHLTLQRVRDNPNVLAGQVEAARRRDCVFVSMRDLFLEQIYEITPQQKGAQPFCAELRGLAGTHLPPLAPLVLLFASAGAIADGKAFRGVVRPGGEIECQLELALQTWPNEGAPEPKRLVRATTTYPRANRIDPPNQIAIWPNFGPRTEWDKYYILDSGRYAGVEAFALGPAITGATLFEALSTDWDLSALRRAAHWVNLRPHFTPGSANTVAVFESAVCPEAFVAVNRDRIDGQAAPLGLLPVPPQLFQDPPRDQQSEVTVAIDFGSTKTSVFKRIGGDIGAMIFQPRLAALLATAGGGRPETAYELLPAQSKGPPITTALRDRAGATSIPELRKAPITGVYIFFHGAPREALDQGFQDDSIHFNLKWPERDHADSTVALQRIQCFLSELVLLCLAEIRGAGFSPNQDREILWRYSYPEAFARKQRARLQVAFTNAVARYARITEGELAQKLASESESVATGRYFRRLPGAPAQGLFVTTDIGGSTTDICIWNDAELVWRTSLKLAGSDMLTDPLARAYLEDLRPVVSADMYRAIGALPPEKRRNAIEILLEDESYSRALRDLGGALDGLLHVKPMAFLVGGAIFYYIGIALAGLINAGKLSTWSGASRWSVDVYLGGGAVKAVRALLSIEQIQEQAPALFLHALHANLATPATVSGRVYVHFSDHPKEEVVRGLLLSSAATARDAVSLPTIPGERLMSAGQAISPAAVGLPETWTVDPDLPGLKAFLGALNDIAELKLLGLNDRVIDLIRRAAVCETGDESERRLVAEPAFISCVRDTLERVLQGQGLTLG